MLVNCCWLFAVGIVAVGTVAVGNCCFSFMPPSSFKQQMAAVGIVAVAVGNCCCWYCCCW